MKNRGLLAVLARFLAATGSSIYVPGSILGRYDDLRSGAGTPAQNVCCSELKLIFRAYLMQYNTNFEVNIANDNHLKIRDIVQADIFGGGVCGLQTQAAIRLTFHDSIGLSKALGSSGRFG
ncbi:hypothetical protein PILCRDRAFT_223467 [Piloderma croceum F 1598]|uniref:Uncharacterized protein n=1 Tax=Piloderma croceum (strain F 1598) TaxID=765440 RepID=A0A0C3BS96_PILCF|nr:hypothetical protein PILCRDRAFT_223467 [Piloderma croceum F 1598]